MPLHWISSFFASFMQVSPNYLIYVILMFILLHMTVSCLPNNPSLSFISSHSPCNIVMLLEMFHFSCTSLFSMIFCYYKVSCLFYFLSAFIFYFPSRQMWDLSSIFLPIYVIWALVSILCTLHWAACGDILPWVTLYFAIIASEEKKKVSFLLQLFFIIFYVFR